MHPNDVLAMFTCTPPAHASSKLRLPYTNTLSAMHALLHHMVAGKEERATFSILDSRLLTYLVI